MKRSQPCLIYMCVAEKIQAHPGNKGDDAAEEKGHETIIKKGMDVSDLTFYKMLMSPHFWFMNVWMLVSVFRTMVCLC